MIIFDDLTSSIIIISVIVVLIGFLSSIGYLLIIKLRDKLTFKVDYSKYNIKPLNKQQLQEEQHFKGIKTNCYKKIVDLSGVRKIER